MAGTISGDATGRHFAPLSDKLSKHSKIFVIDPERLVGAKAAHFAAKHWPAAWPTFIFVRPLTIGSRPAFHLCHNYFLFFKSLLRLALIILEIDDRRIIVQIEVSGPTVNRKTVSLLSSGRWAWLRGSLVWRENAALPRAL